MTCATSLRRIPSDANDAVAAMSGRESPNASKPY